jgi:hypothetical protein
VRSQEPTHRKVGSKPHSASRGILSKLGLTCSNSCQIAQCWIFIYLFIWGLINGGTKQRRGWSPIGCFLIPGSFILGESQGRSVNCRSTWIDMWMLAHGKLVNSTPKEVRYHMIVYVTMVTFQMTLLMNKWTNIVIDDDGWVHPLAKNPTFYVSNLWWNIVMDDWDMDEKSLGKWRKWQHYKPIISQKNSSND